MSLTYRIEGFFVEFHDFMELCDFLVHLPFKILLRFRYLLVYAGSVPVCWIDVAAGFYAETGRYTLGFIDYPRG